MNQVIRDLIINSSSTCHSQTISRLSYILYIFHIESVKSWGFPYAMWNSYYASPPDRMFLKQHATTVYRKLCPTTLMSNLWLLHPLKKTRGCPSGTRVDRLQSMILHDIFTSVGVFPAMGVHPRVRDPPWSDRISPVIEIRSAYGWNIQKASCGPSTYWRAWIKPINFS